jgi:type II secretory pathway component HofQ
MLMAGATCGVNIVIPQHVQARVTVDLTNVRCDQAIETLLEAQDLGYTYEPTSNVMLVGPRKDMAAAPQPRPSDLPDGHRVTLNVKDALLHDVLRQLIAGERVNLVIPDYIDGRVTVRLKDAPWNTSFEAILASHDLWYRYRENGRIISVGPRKDILEERTR